MSGVAWERVEELYFACEVLSAAERGELLDRACSDDQELRERVESLLAAGAQVGDRFEAAVRDALLGAEADGDWDLVEPVPQRIGSFRILQVLGEGGMGIVHLAERDDGVFRQRVAIKVVRRDLASPQLVRRFRRERQILARLEHPAVARLLDGGTTDDGLPFLVMEHVEGEPIDEYCNRQRLTVDQRLDLFAKVCDAVQSAHSRLVVHRDLKPSNILVTAEGQPKLLDFGISKLLESDETEADAAVTVLGQRALTPEYASPEQVCDEPITTAVDVYALGLLLHRLLCGERPYSLPGTRGEELRRAICDTVPERPSAGVARLSASDPAAAGAIAAARSTDPRRLRRRLAGDLDQIVAKALRKAPADRYGSPRELADDLARHRAGRPVVARRGGRRYLAGRFVRRHRAWVAGVAAVVLALVLGLVAQRREAERANREARRANTEAAVSAQTVGFLIDLFGAADPYQTRETLTASELLRRGVERIETELADQPLVQAQLLAALGRVHHNRGRFVEAEPLFEAALARRLAVLPPHHLDVAASQLDLADDLRVLGRAREAMPHYFEAARIRGEQLGDDSVELAEVLNNEGLGFLSLGHYAPAARLFERALAIRRQRLGDHQLVGHTLHNLTLLAIHRGRFEEAVERAHEVLALKERVLPADHPSTGRTLLLLGRAELELDHWAAADQALERSERILVGAFGDGHLDALAVRGYRAWIRHLRGHSREAEQALRELLGLQRESLGPEDRAIAITLGLLARVVEERGDLDQAERLAREALDLRQRVLEPDQRALADSRCQLGALLVRRGDLDAAEPLLREALAVRQKALPPTHPRLAESQLELARLELARGDLAAACGAAVAAVDIAALGLPGDHPLALAALGLAGRCQGASAPRARATGSSGASRE